MAQGPPNLLSLLAAAEHELAADDVAPSEFAVDSEERDQLLLTQQMEDDLELKSQSSISTRQRQRRPGQRSSSHGQRGGRSSRSRDGTSAQSYGKPHTGSDLSYWKLQQLQHQLYESEGSSDSPCTEELWSVLQQTNQHMVSLREVEASAAATHRQEMAMVQAKLDQARDQELHAEKERLNAEAKASISEAAHQVEIDILQRSIDNNWDNKISAEEDAAANDTFLKEVEDFASQQIDKIKNDIEERRKRQASQDEAKRKENAQIKNDMVIEMASLSTQLEKTRKELRIVSDERDVLRRNVARRWGCGTIADNLQIVLGVANQELEKVKQAARSGKMLKQAAPDLSQVYELLSQSRDSQVDMDREMRLLREQWYKDRAQIDRAAEQRELESNQGVGERSSTSAGGSSSSSTSSSSRGGSLPGGPRAMRNKASSLSKQSWSGSLLSIAEEQDADLISGDGSVARAESCDGDEESRAPGGMDSGVADLADFDIQQAMNVATPAALAAAVKVKEKILKDKVSNIVKTKEEVRRQKQLLQTEMAEREAELNSKIAEVRAQLAVTKDEAIRKEEAAVDLQRGVAKEDVKISKVAEKGRVELDMAERKKEAKEEHIWQLFNEVTRREFQDAEDKALWLDLCRELTELIQMAKEAEEDAERQKLHMDASRERQDGIVADMQQQLASLRGRPLSATKESCDDDGEGNQVGAYSSEELPPMGEMEKMEKELKDATEERNVLLNTAEWKEVQWRNVIEDLQSRIASERLVLQAKHAVEIQQQKEQLRHELESFRLSLAR